IGGAASLQRLRHRVARGRLRRWRAAPRIRRTGIVLSFPSRNFCFSTEKELTTLFTVLYCRRQATPSRRIGMAEKVAKVGVKREPGFLYFLRGSDVWKTPMKRAGGPSAAGKAEKVAAGNFNRAEGYLYFLDSAGDVSRAKRAVGGQKRKAKAGKKGAGKKKAAKKATKKAPKKKAGAK